ncbi:hypothetical protein AAFF_G00422790 [Aldrovandia affinis]|uniref:Uncharacterized protein n=1 Tax=Aldrovandia affinis TaxID=143900 RepID=A0AAD7T6E9_9TELE|nr:hypothetical protein AAFF_G00422790 [Aldrovandia affinis]
MCWLLIALGSGPYLRAFCPEVRLLFTGAAGARSPPRLDGSRRGWGATCGRLPLTGSPGPHPPLPSPPAPAAAQSPGYGARRCSQRQWEELEAAKDDSTETAEAFVRVIRVCGSTKAQGEVGGGTGNEVSLVGGRLIDPGATGEGEEPAEPPGETGS